MSGRPPRKTIYNSDEVKNVRPYRMQYNMTEAGYMLCVSAETVKKWADKFGVPVYKIKDSDGKWYIKHDELVRLLEVAIDQHSYDIENITRGMLQYGPSDHTGNNEYRGDSDLRRDG